MKDSDPVCWGAKAHTGAGTKGRGGCGKGNLRQKKLFYSCGVPQAGPTPVLLGSRVVGI